MIHKTFFGTHIDLSKIIEISDAYYIDQMGHGGLSVGFKIIVQLRDKPIYFSRDLDSDEEVNFRIIEEDSGGSYHEVKMIDGTWKKYNQVFSLMDQILAVQNLQKQIDELIQVWKDSKNE